MSRSLNRVVFSTGSDEWETPPDLFAELDAEFHFTLDLAANSRNHKCDRWIGPGSVIAEDALNYPIDRNDVCWLNPPYSRGLQSKFIEKVVTSRAHVVALLPARTDTIVFHDWIWDRMRCEPQDWVREVHFLKGRLKFVGAESSAPFPSMIVEFG